DPLGLWSWKKAFGAISTVTGVVATGIAVASLFTPLAPITVGVGTALAASSVVAGAAQTYLECTDGGGADRACVRDGALTTMSAVSLGAFEAVGFLGRINGEVFDPAYRLLQGIYAVPGIGATLAQAPN